MINLNCKVCNKQFSVLQCHAKRRKTCSKSCLSVYMTNKPRHRKWFSRHSTFDDNFFEKIDTDEKAYLLGWIASDGHINDKGFVIGIHKKDIKIFSIFDKILNINNEINHKKNSNIIEYRVYSKKIQYDLCKLLGLFFVKNQSHKKSYILKFPKLDNDKLTWAFLRGYFDGDGCVKKTSKIKPWAQASITTSSEFIVSGIVNFCKIPFKINKYKNLNKYKLYWCGKNAIKFLNSIYIPDSHCLNRKYLKYKKCLRNIKHIKNKRIYE